MVGDPDQMGLALFHIARYKMNLAMDELKGQWRVEKAALELADAQNDINDVSSNSVVWETSKLCPSRDGARRA